MVWCDQHVGAQALALPHHQRLLLRTLDVAGQQHARGRAAGRAAFHLQHARERVGLRAPLVGRRGGLQDLEAHPVPGPGLPGHAAGLRRPGRAQRMPVLQRAHQGVDGHAPDEGARAADVVGVAMAEHQGMHPRLAPRAQQRDQHALAGVALARVLRAGVVDEQVAAGSHQHRGALPDVGGQHLEAAGRRARDRGQQQRQRERHGERAQPPRQGGHEHARRQQPGRLRPRRGHGGRPHPAGPVRQPREAGAQPLHHPRPERPQRRGQHAEQRERRDDERHQRDRDQVGGEAHQRHLLEAHQRERREAQRRDDLPAQLPAQALEQQGRAPRWHGRRRAPDLARRQQQPDRGERQPEPGLQQRPRVERGHHHGRGEPDERPGPPLAACLQRGHRGEHPHGALRGHAPAREDRIARGRGEPAPAPGQRRRAGDRRACAASPQRRDRQAREPGEQGHVQPADGHQVGDAGVAEEVPVLPVDGGLVADRQRSEHARGAPVGHGGLDGVAHALARLLHGMAGRCLQALRRRRVAHAAGGAHTLLEELELLVEAVRIARAVRLPQTHREAPALARAQRALLGRERRVVAVARAPAERHRARHRDRHAVPAGLLQLEAVAQAPRRALRQPRDDPDDVQVLPFQRGRQRLGQACDGAQSRGAEGGCGEGGCAQRDEHAPARPGAGHRDRDEPPRRQQRGIGGCGQDGAFLELQEDAGQPRQRPGAQAPADGPSCHGGPV